MAIKVARGSRGPIARRTMAICAHFLLRAAAAVIYASKENDPGTIDLFGNFRERMLKEGSMMMDTVKCARAARSWRSARFGWCEPRLLVRRCRERGADPNILS